MLFAPLIGREWFLARRQWPSTEALAEIYEVIFTNTLNRLRMSRRGDRIQQDLWTWSGETNVIVPTSNKPIWVAQTPNSTALRSVVCAWQDVHGEGPRSQILFPFLPFKGCDRLTGWTYHLFGAGTTTISCSSLGHGEVCRTREALPQGLAYALRYHF